MNSNLNLNKSMKTKGMLMVLLSIFILGLTSILNSQSAKKLATTDKYKVIRVDGRIIFQRTKADMKKGDVFLSGTALSFATPHSRAAVISGVKGRFVLSSSEKGQTKILPAANTISSRSGALLNRIDLKNHFSGDYLILNELKLEIGNEAFPMDEENFFYLAYEYQNETIRKKLSFSENTLLIDKNEVFKIDGNPIPPMKTTMGLYYMQNGNGGLISEFTPVFPNIDELKDEVEIILDEFSDKSDDVKIQEITAYLGEFYGKPQKDNLSLWLISEFDLK